MDLEERPVALVMHEACGRHDTGWRHPEHAGRLRGVVRALEADTPTLHDYISQREATPATVDQIARVHEPAYIEMVRDTARRATAEHTLYRLDPDTVVSPASWDAALAAAGCAVDAARLVASSGAAGAFAACRPPGHHALPDRAMGFCLFNNVAIAARALQVDHAAERIMIIDWDVHHGNGTQETFYEDPTVYYLSLHQAPWYPGSGAAHDRGAGDGLGTTRNVPLAAGTAAAELRAAFERAVDDAIREFEPDFVLVSAGFDALRGDPLGRMLLEPADFHAMTRLLVDRSPDGRLALVLEGGYVPDRLGASVVDVVRALAGLSPRD